SPWHGVGAAEACVDRVRTIVRVDGACGVSLADPTETPEGYSGQLRAGVGLPFPVARQVQFDFVSLGIVEGSEAMGIGACAGNDIVLTLVLYGIAVLFRVSGTAECRVEV